MVVCPDAGDMIAAAELLAVGWEHGMDSNEAQGQLRRLAAEFPDQSALLMAVAMIACDSFQVFPMWRQEGIAEVLRRGAQAIAADRDSRLGVFWAGEEEAWQAQ